MNLIASELKIKLDRLSSLVSAKGLVDNCDKIIFGDGVIHAFNGEIFIAVPFESDIKGAVMGEPFHKIISKHGTDEVEITVEGIEMAVTRRRSSSRFVFDPDATCPVEIDFSEDKWIKLPDNFLEALNICSYTCGTDYTDVRTVCIHVRGRIAESSDSCRVTRFKLSSKVEDELFIPVEALRFLNKSKPVSYCKTDKWVFFKDLDGAIICHRQIHFSEEYPDLMAIIDRVKDCHEVLLPEKLYDSLEKASVFLSDKFEGDRFVTIRCKEGNLRLISNGNAGSYKEILKIDFEDTIRFEINPDFLMQIMEKSNQVQVTSDFLKIETKDCSYLTALASGG